MMIKLLQMLKEWRLSRGVRRVLLLGGCFLAVVMIIIILNIIDYNSIEQSRQASYGRYEKNVLLFEELVEQTDLFCSNLLSSRAMYSFYNAEAAQVMGGLLVAKKPDLPLAVLNFIPYGEDTAPYLLFFNMKSISMASHSFGDVVLYAPSSDVYLVVTEKGINAVCQGQKEFQDFSAIGQDIGTLTDCTLVVPGKGSQLMSPLLILRRLNDSLIALFGVTDDALNDSLYAHSAGRSFNEGLFRLYLPNDTMMDRSMNPVAADKTLLSLFDGKTEKLILKNDVTYLYYNVGKTDAILLVSQVRSGVSNAFVTPFFEIFLIFCVLWGIMMIVGSYYLYRYIYVPIINLKGILPPSQEPEKLHVAQSVERVQVMLSEYQYQIMAGESQIRQNKQILRSELLKSHILGLDNLAERSQEFSDLQTNYCVLLVLPSFTGQSSYSITSQEMEYKRHMAGWQAYEQLEPEYRKQNIDILTIAEEVVIVRPMSDKGENDYISEITIEIQSLRSELNNIYVLGVSQVHNGLSELRLAYQEAKWNALETETRETKGKSNQRALGDTMKKSADMADLIYLEQYVDAWAMFQETLQIISQIENRRLAEEQMRMFLRITERMLLETNSTNGQILRDNHIQLARLTELHDMSEIVDAWAFTFQCLQKSHDEVVVDRFSDRFRSVYEYVQKNFRDANLSLLFLADQFQISASTLTREFQKYTGQGFLECLHHWRIEAAKRQIQCSDASLVDIAEDVGYNNALTMTRAFKKYLGVTPGSFRPKAQDKSSAESN